MRIISSLDDYGVLDVRGVTVISADTTELDTIELPYTGIPTVKGLSVSYDTLKQIVTLTWNAADTGLVQGYNVYRQHVDSGLVKLNAAPITDTTYSDSTVTQDQTYAYQVKALDKDGNEGLFSVGMRVEAVTSFTLLETYGNGTGTGDGFFNSLRGIAIDSRGNILCADNGNHRIQKLDGLGNFVLKWGVQGADSGQFSDPEDVAIDSLDNVYVVDAGNDRIQVFDSSGILMNIWAGLNSPGHIEIVGGTAYVSEWSGNIRKYDLSGSLLDTYDVGSPIRSLAALDTMMIVGIDSLVLKFSENGALLDTLYVSSPIPGGSSTRPPVRAISATDSLVLVSQVVTQNNYDDAIIGISLSGNKIFQYVTMSESGTPMSTVQHSGRIYIATHDGYIRKYSR